MTETIYVTGVVIANGVTDTDGDLLTKKDIKTIFTKYTNRETDTMHKNIKNTGVSVLANWISETDTIINGETVPSGSWLATFKITNPQLIQCINEGRLRGLSLGSVSEEAMTPKYWFINKSMNYRDLTSIEEVIPLFISFVDNPANKYGFEVMEYDAYINKNNKNGVEMTDNKQEEMVSISALTKLRDLFISKAEDEVPPAEEETVEETPSEVTALFEKLDTIIEQNNQILAFINKEDDEEVEDETADDEEIEKAEDDDEKEDEETTEDKTAEEDDEKIEKSETVEEETTEDETEEETVEEPVVEKRQTNMVENQIVTENKTFYQNTGRDHLGRKIKK